MTAKKKAPSVTKAPVKAASPKKPRALKVHASEPAAAIVKSMGEKLGLWKTQLDATLFLAALACVNGKKPIPVSSRVEMGNLYTVMDFEDPREMALFKILGNRETLDDALVEDLIGLIEAGSRMVAPVLEEDVPIIGFARLIEASASAG